MLQPESYWDLNAVLADAGSLLGRLIGEDIEVSLRLEPLPARVCADAGQMQQVVMTWRVNARDAMPSEARSSSNPRTSRSRRARRSPDPGLPPGRYALLSVSDTGAGMTEEGESSRFRAFLHHQGSGQGHRTGAGHRLRESSSRVGAAFSSRASRARARPSASTCQPSSRRWRRGPRRMRPSSPITGERRPFLLVEDQPAVRKLMRNLLSSLGYQVLEAGTAMRRWRSSSRPGTLPDDADRPGHARYERPGARGAAGSPCGRESASFTSRATRTACRRSRALRTTRRNSIAKPFLAARAGRQGPRGARSGRGPQT